MSFRVAQLQNMCLSLLRGSLYLKEKERKFEKNTQALSIIFREALWIFFVNRLDLFDLRVLFCAAPRLMQTRSHGWNIAIIKPFYFWAEF